MTLARWLLRELRFVFRAAEYDAWRAANAERIADIVAWAEGSIVNG